MFRKMVNASVRLVQRYLPEPFIFALLLTFISFAVAMPVCKQTPLEVLTNWGNGVWELLAFSMQMALVLVCGSTLADAPAIKKGLNKLASMPKRPVGAIALVSLVSALACWINWGFGLIIGVIFAKSIARKMRGVDYRLLIASAYSGFLVWHGGISGSIPLALATPGTALTAVTMGVVTEPIPISNTVLSIYNLGICLFVIIALVVANSLMHPKGKEVIEVDPRLLEEEEEDNSFKPSTPAEKAENSIAISIIITIMGLAFLVVKFVRGESLDLNTVIMIFLFLGILFHKTPIAYVKSLNKAAVGCAGILLQFPFYAGIMGIMTGTSAEGVSLAGEISNLCVNISNEHTFPLLTFLSAGLVNIFIPSGGGQWALQGPIMMPAGAALGVAPAVTGMAIAWGDAWTNLIQPFWAIPALAIAKLGARDIMGYCLINLLISGIIICLGFLIWVI
ncbi:MAG: short-chain fatty acid transporter [Bacteroidales bacterium]|jgi:short-chain fatty acids transporter|nr:short-chain fatty acid transporter [Bacteroidales bacterium]